MDPIYTIKTPDNHEELFSELRKRVNLNSSRKDKVLDQVKEIVGYVHNLFMHNGNTIPKSLSPLDIIEAAKKGNSMRCVEYSFLSAALLWTCGIPARVIGLKKKTVETDFEGAGHVVIEFWDKDQNKWIMCDPQEGIIPFVNEVPLSAYELGENINKSSNIYYELVSKSRFSLIHSLHYTNWIKDYLYYYDTAVAQNYMMTNEDRLAQQKIMLIPKNASEPRIFQRKFPINAIYVTDPKDFYKEPQ